VKRPWTPSRLAALGLVGLALFAVLFRVSDALGLWPEPPQGGFAGSDLAAGLLFGVVLLGMLAAGGRSARRLR
jgi:hypothetical protein